MIQIRVTENEQRLLNQIAKQEQRKAAELIREWIYNAARLHGLWPPAVKHTD